MEKSPWFWQGLFNFYLPKAVGMFKDIPITRTEYKDENVEFVLDISSFGPRAYIHGVTDINIQATSIGWTSIAPIWVHVQALQVTLHEILFYYKDRTASVILIALRRGHELKQTRALGT